MLAMPFNVEQIRTAHWPASPQRHVTTDAMLRHATAAHDPLLPLLFAAGSHIPMRRHANVARHRRGAGTLGGFDGPCCPRDLS
jgi:hypothetical protein